MSRALKDPPPLLWGTKRKDTEARKELVRKFIDQGCTKAEAERQMIVAVFRRHVQYILNVKKIPAERLHLAIDESLVEEVQES